MYRAVDLHEEPSKVSIEEAPLAGAVEPKCLPTRRYETGLVGQPSEVDLGKRVRTACNIADDQTE